MNVLSQSCQFSSVRTGKLCGALRLPSNAIAVALWLERRAHNLRWHERHASIYRLRGNMIRACALVRCLTCDGTSGTLVATSHAGQTKVVSHTSWVQQLCNHNQNNKATGESRLVLSPVHNTPTQTGGLAGHKPHG